MRFFTKTASRLTQGGGFDRGSRDGIAGSASVKAGTPTILPSNSHSALLPATSNCKYAITYTNERKIPCSDGGCGVQIAFDAIGVSAVGDGCPSSLAGLQVTELAYSDYGCTNSEPEVGAGCAISAMPPIASGHGVLSGCRDIYGICGLAGTSPEEDCTQKVTQQLFVGGVFAEKHTILFEFKAGDCNGTVTRL
jgi:hypothetical protein